MDSAGGSNNPSQDDDSRKASSTNDSANRLGASFRKGDVLTLKHCLNEKQGLALWEVSSEKGRKAKCLFLEDEIEYQETDNAVIVNVPVSSKPQSLVCPKALFRKRCEAAEESARLFSRAELHELAQLRSHYFEGLQEEALEVRHELVDAQEKLRMLVRLADVYDDTEEAVHATAAFPVYEREMQLSVVDPYISVWWDRENAPPPKLAALVQSRTPIALGPPRKLFIQPILHPIYNMNVVSDADLKDLPTLNFNVLKFHRQMDKEKEREHHLIMCLLHMFHGLGLIKEFQIPEDTLFRFLMCLSRKYRDVPFHCWYHAFNVTQTMYYFLTTCNIKKIFGNSKLELFAMLIACLTHDTDHPGLNNIFQKKAQTNLAKIHSASILENHHLIQAKILLSQPHCDILCNLSKEDTSKFYLFLTRMIMATDLALHKQILTELEEFNEHIKAEFQKDKPHLSLAERVAVVALCMKCADLSNEIRPYNVSFLWASRINDEFFKQTDKERELGLPVTPFMDPEKVVIAQEQGNFIQGLCMPLYKALVHLFPTAQPCCDQMASNKATWDKNLDLTKPALIKQSAWEEEEEVKEEKKTDFNVPKLNMAALPVGANEPAGNRPNEGRPADRKDDKDNKPKKKSFFGL